MSQATSVERKYRGLVEALPAVGTVLDGEGRFVEVLTDGHEEAPFGGAAVVGRTVFDVFPDAVAERFHAAVRSAIETEEVQTLAYELDAGDGVRRFEARVAPIPGDSTSVTCLVETTDGSDDPDRWLGRVESALSDPERGFEATLDELFGVGRERFGFEDGAVARVDPADGRLRVEYASEGGERLDPGTEPPVSAACRVALCEPGGPAVVTAADAVAGGTGVESCLGTLVPVEGGPDRTLLFVSTEPRTTGLADDERLFLDLMAEWLKAELDREAHERRLDAIFDRTYQFTGLVEADGTVVEANPTGLEFGGLEREDVVGEKLWATPWFRNSEETRKRTRRAVRRAAEGEFVRNDELRVQGANRETTVDFAVRPITDDGAVTHLVFEGRDITERKRSEERVAALNEACRRLWDAESETEIAETTVDVAETILGEHLVAVWSYDAEADELVPLAAADAAATMDKRRELDDEFGTVPPGTEEMTAFREGETRVITDYRTVDSPASPGTPLRTLLIVPLGDHGQLHVGSETVTAFDDGTREMVEILARNAEAALERRSRERELERNRNRLTRTERLADVGGWELDLRTNELTWTDGTRRIHGVDDDFEPTLENGVGFYHPKDRDAVRRAVMRCLEDGEPYDLEARLVTTDGRERWVATTGEAVESDGEIVRLRGAIRDITERREREQQLSVLYRILRHNLRNDLTVISGVSGMIDRELDRIEIPAAIAGREVEAFRRVADRVSDPSGDLERDVEALERTMDSLSATRIDEVRQYHGRMENVVEQLVSIGERAGRLHGLIVDGGEVDLRCRLDAIVEAVADDLRREYDASIETEGVEEIVVEGASEKLTLALRELVDNAVRHAEDDAPTVTVRTIRTGPDHVTVEVVDRGPGIPTEELEALRRGEEGALVHTSGLGLWVVNWLATLLDGHLEFEANEPRGTVASLTLPAVGREDGSA